jgi:uncharacterized protein (DUF362 family)
MRRRDFIRIGAGGAITSLLPAPVHAQAFGCSLPSTIFGVDGIPDDPFPKPGSNHHEGVEALLHLMGRNNLKFYRSWIPGTLSGPSGLIAPEDVVLIKVNAQWKYRGATNSDVVRGIIQRILDHPQGFRGEVVVFENGQGRGSLACDTSSYYSDAKVHANALDESHSFEYVVKSIFKDSRVSTFLLDPIRGRFIGADDHATNGYRTLENISYPCFTTAGGRRVELREGLWNGSGHDPGLKLINVPVLKTHGGSEFTGAMKHFYGVLSMSDGGINFRHYSGLGETVGKMAVLVRPPVLNIMDAVWVSHKALEGYPASSTFKASRLAASRDPLALDYWAAKNILYPIDRNSSHLPDNAVIQEWMGAAETVINDRGGLFRRPGSLFGSFVTKDEGRMLVLGASARKSG